MRLILVHIAVSEYSKLPVKEHQGIQDFAFCFLQSKCITFSSGSGLPVQYTDT
jgi:hypothetical protein